MILAMPNLASALTGWRGSSDVARRAEADNSLFEECIGGKRQAFFEDFAADAASAEGLRRRHVDYCKEHIEVSEVPHTFQLDFEPAASDKLDEHQRIVRVECLSRPLQNYGIAYEKLRAAFDSGDHAYIHGFLSSWDIARDARPGFAAFKEQLAEELDAPDWPCRLRDRLGLAHYDARGGPIPIALMEYSVGEVLAALDDPGVACAITRPTVLDSRPWPWFFPAPAELCYGRTMSLAAIDDYDMLLAEILHCRLSYRRHHLVRLGEIRRPVVGLDLRTLRNDHLMALRLAADREAFGEEIPQ